jgi:hypothetical protein
MFQPAKSEGSESIFNKTGAHYNIYKIDREQGMRILQEIFPEGVANEMNFVLFSTSGVHGTYKTIEEIEISLQKYGELESKEDAPEERIPEDYTDPSLTILIVHPRIVCLQYGEIKISLKDIGFLKKLRESSIEAVKLINV